MKTYQYQILRYLPDKVSGEFINLGVVAFDPINSDLSCLFYIKTTRLHRFFPSSNARFVTQTIRNIDSGLKRISKELKKPMLLERYDSLHEITVQLLPKDDSALFFTEVKFSLDLNLNYLLQDLFARLVIKNIQEEDNDGLQDKEVWKKIYKSYFDKYGLTKKLQPAKVKTHLDEWNFERTCQNGALHCFETVSFELSNADYIKKKVYTWAGRVDELKTSKQDIHLYLLSALPEQKKLVSFIKEKLGKLEYKNAVVQLVDISNAEIVLKSVQKLVNEHDIALANEKTNIVATSKLRHKKNDK